MIYNDTQVRKLYVILIQEEINYGKGEYEVGEIELKSNQTLFLDEGAVVYAYIKAIDARNIRILGRHKPLLPFIGFDENHKTKDILIDNLYRNDRLITSLDLKNFKLGKYTENIRLEASDLL